MMIEHQCSECPISFHGAYGAEDLVRHHRLVHAATVRPKVRIKPAPPWATKVVGCPGCLPGGPSHDPCTNHGQAHCSAEGCF